MTDADCSRTIRLVNHEWASLVMAELLGQDEALGLLGRHAYGLRAEVVSAWDDYDDHDHYSPTARATHDNTVSANCIHAHIRARVGLYAQRHESEMRIVSVNRMFALSVECAGVTIGLRFKKLNSKLQTANVDTAQVRAFKRQEDIPQLGVKHHLEIGYLLNSTEDAVMGVFLLCPNGEHSNYWAVEILDNETSSVVSDLFERRAADAVATADDDDDSSNVKPREKADVVAFPKREKKDGPDKA